MATVVDVVQALGDDAWLAVPAADPLRTVSGVVPWEPSLRYAPDTVLAGIGVTGQRLLDETSAGIIVRAPGGKSQDELIQKAGQRGIPLVLLGAAASWAEVLRAVAELGRTEPPSEISGHVQPGDLFGLAEAFADLVGGPIIIEDANFRVLAYSSFTGAMDQGRNTAILGRRMPPEWLAFLEATGDLERLRTGTAVIDLPSGPWQANRRLITAVRSPTALLGVIWAAAEGDRALPPSAPTSLRLAADIAIPHLVRHQEGHRAERRRRGQLLRSLLEGRGPLHRHADELGLPRDSTLTVLAFAPVSEDAFSEDTWDRITDHVALSCEAFRWHAAVARLGRAVLVVLAQGGGHDDDGPLRLGRDIVSRSVPALRETLCGAASTSGQRLRTLPQRRLEAEDALGIVHSQRGRGQFVSYDEMRPAIILRAMREVLTERIDLRLPGIDALREEDDRRQAELLHTLRTFLRSGAHAPTAARRLGIHVTTLRYRLGRVRAVSGLELDDPAVRLACELLLDLE